MFSFIVMLYHVSLYSIGGESAWQKALIVQDINGLVSIFVQNSTEFWILLEITTSQTWATFQYSFHCYDKDIILIYILHVDLVQ